MKLIQIVLSTFPQPIQLQYMIKGKYKQLQLLKSREDKVLQLCQRQDGQTYFLKSYASPDNPHITNQIRTYQILKQPHLHGFPQIQEAFEDKGRAYLVIEELGEDLEALRKKCGGRLTLKTVLFLALQMLERVEYLHSHGVLHGDIKPSNFLIGRGKFKHKVYLTDFELSTPYLRHGKHVPQEARDKFSGSLRFSSRAANSKSMICRRDELQSLVYVWIYLLKGELPWMEIKAKSMQTANEQVYELKGKGRPQLLEGLPETFGLILNYLQELKFASTPDYSKPRNLLQSLIKKNGYELDYKFDWQYL